MAALRDAGICVLIVDDDEYTLGVSRQLVRQAAPTANVITANDAPQAMAYLMEASRPVEGRPRPNVILLDINMPGTGGFEVLAWLRRYPPLADIKVVMLSTSTSQSDITQAAELGADGYLIKFPNPAVLASVLQEASRAKTPKE